MKKIAILVSILMILLVSTISAKENKSKQVKKDKEFEKIMKDFQMEAVMKTTQGNITFFLYPEAAPKNVANFVFLAKNDFYNGLPFFKWLTFDVEGMLAMSNSGPNTNSSQFFITMRPIKELNGKHTIIGGTKNRDDLRLLRTLRENDKILSIDIKGKKVDKFLDYFPNEVKEWETKLKKPVN